MMEQETKSASSAIMLCGLITGLFVLLEWVCVTNIIHVKQLYLFYYKIENKTSLFRILYTLLTALSCYFTPGRKMRKEHTENLRVFFISFWILLTGLVMLGPKSSYDFYNTYFFPIVFVLQIPLTAMAVLSIFGNNLKNERFFKGVSHKDSEFYFEFGTEAGPLRVHSPQQGIWIDGGTGSGKSDTFIKSIITQSALRGYPGWVYDWEGDPTKEKSPILGKVVYGSVCEAKKRNKNLALEFAFINFTDMSRTVRVNVLSERYFNPNNASLFIRNMIITLMKNLEPSWKEKTDFWANNAINYVYSVAYKCYKDRAKGINTLPHVISICLSECNAVFTWLSEDKEISKNMASMFSAWKLKADQQTAGAVSSAQLPLVLLNNKYIFWVLSPKKDDEFNLDITNPKNPVLLCVGNAPSISESVSPAISCIVNVVMGQMNSPGKIPSIFLNDEFPTFIIFGIEKFISTVRKWGVSTILALQNFSQAQANYGDKLADIIKSGCGTQIYGMTSNDKTAESIEKLLGEQKEINFSYSEQDYGGGSRSESYQKEKVIKMRDIAGQCTGHFIAKVANGNPVYSSTQFDYDPGISRDIPRFSIPINTGDEQKDIDILEAIVEENYKRIEAETAQLLGL